VIPVHGLAVKTGTVTAAVTTTKGGLLWQIAEQGTFNVTTLDGNKFAGTFQMKIAEIGADLKLTGTTATVFGTFDLACSANPANVCK